MISTQDEVENLLRQRIDEILCYIWDPIGVSSDGTPQTRGEYKSYVNPVMDAVKEGKSVQEVAHLIDAIATDEMELESHMDHSTEISEIIFNWSKYLHDQLSE